ncbi:Uncharacterized protein (Fragment) [Durusdinium trenchii]|uniref:receptor protein-tyrosine kinase n=1 Tax=Durusdinium trenchii TaxID=1381693 RepID=A0ABP0S3E3_9DINO
MASKWLGAVVGVVGVIAAANGQVPLREEVLLLPPPGSFREMVADSFGRVLAGTTSGDVAAFEEDAGGSWQLLNQTFPSFGVDVDYFALKDGRVAAVDPAGNIFILNRTPSEISIAGAAKLTWPGFSFDMAVLGSTRIALWSSGPIFEGDNITSKVHVFSVGDIAASNFSEVSPVQLIDIPFPAFNESDSVFNATSRLRLFVTGSDELLTMDISHGPNAPFCGNCASEVWVFASAPGLGPFINPQVVFSDPLGRPVFPAPVTDGNKVHVLTPGLDWLEISVFDSGFSSFSRLVADLEVIMGGSLATIGDVYDQLYDGYVGIGNITEIRDGLSDVLIPMRASFRMGSFFGYLDVIFTDVDSGSTFRHFLVEDSGTQYLEVPVNASTSSAQQAFEQGDTVRVFRTGSNNITVTDFAFGDLVQPLNGATSSAPSSASPTPVPTPSSTPASTNASATTDWSQEGADIDGEFAGDQSGSAVSLSSDGNTVAIGAPSNTGNGDNSGHVRVYRFNSTGWTQLGGDIDGEAVGDFSGLSVSLSSDGNTVAIGAQNNDGNGTSSGHVRVYRFNSTGWAQRGADIDGEAAGANSGFAVSLSSDGNTVAIGAPRNDGNGTESGHVRVYRFESSEWAQLGADIDGEASFDQSGRSVSLSSDGNTVAIGAPENDGAANRAGHVRVYRYDSIAWTKMGDDIDGDAAEEQAGWSVSLASDGNTVAIGAPFNNENSFFAGQVRVYRFDASAWTQLGNDIAGQVNEEGLGYSVSLSSDGNTVATGSPFNGGSNGSRVQVYRFDSSEWTQLGADIDAEAPGDLSGSSVMLSSDGSTVAIGAPGNDGNGSNAGHVRVYRSVMLGSPTGSPSPTTLPTASPTQGPCAFVTCPNSTDCTEHWCDNGLCLSRVINEGQTCNGPQPGQCMDGFCFPTAYQTCQELGLVEELGTSTLFNISGTMNVSIPALEQLDGVRLQMVGGGGGAGLEQTGVVAAGGPGGFVDVAVVAFAGQNLTVQVGAGGSFASTGGLGGFPDGGNAGSISALSQRGNGGGGGSSRVYLGDALVAVAGGGGGGGVFSCPELLIAPHGGAGGTDAASPGQDSCGDGIVVGGNNAFGNGTEVFSFGANATNSSGGSGGGFVGGGRFGDGGGSLGGDGGAGGSSYVHPDWAVARTNVKNLVVASITAPCESCGDLVSSGNGGGRINRNGVEGLVNVTFFKCVVGPPTEQPTKAPLGVGETHMPTQAPTRIATGPPPDPVEAVSTGGVDPFQMGSFSFAVLVGGVIGKLVSFLATKSFRSYRIPFKDLAAMGHEKVQVLNALKELSLLKAGTFRPSQSNELQIGQVAVAISTFDLSRPARFGAFISYSNDDVADASQIREIVEDLVKHNTACTIAFDPDGPSVKASPGDLDALASSANMLIVLTPNFVESTFCMVQLIHALNHPEIQMRTLRVEHNDFDFVALSRTIKRAERTRTERFRPGKLDHDPYREEPRPPPMTTRVADWVRGKGAAKDSDLTVAPESPA